MRWGTDQVMGNNEEDQLRYRGSSTLADTNQKGDTDAIVIQMASNETGYNDDRGCSWIYQQAETAAVTDRRGINYGGGSQNGGLLISMLLAARLNQPKKAGKKYR